MIDYGNSLNNHIYQKKYFVKSIIFKLNLHLYQVKTDYFRCLALPLDAQDCIIT